MKKVSKVFQGSFKSVSRKMETFSYLKEVQRLFQWSFKPIAKTFKEVSGVYKKVSSVFKENSRELQECFNEFFCDFVVAQISSQLTEQREGHNFARN